MSDKVWLIMPVVNEDLCRANVPRWLAQGYHVCLLQDRTRFDVPGTMILQPWSHYAGYAFSVNFATRELQRHGLLGDVFVYAGEDMHPDPQRNAQEVAERYRTHYPDLNGIVQPTGDDLNGTDRICGSPIVGRDAFKEFNNGFGIFWPGYNHYFADEELFNVSLRHGRLVQDRDLMHYHDHWTRSGTPSKRPHHKLLEERWANDKALFNHRKALDFPGSWKESQ